MGAIELRETTTMVASILEDLAMLIGEYRSTPMQLSNGESIVPGLGQTTDAVLLRRRAADIHRGLFTILVVGKFSHGKSTLINALLGRELVRARAIPTTAVITVIAHGDRSDVAIFDRGRMEPRYLDWHRFTAQYCLRPDAPEAPANPYFEEIDYAQIETNHPFVAQGIKLVDTPGLGEDDTRTETTRRFLSQAQAVLLVLDANRLLGDDERRFIRSSFGDGRLEHVFFIVNRLSTVDPEETTELDQRMRRTLHAHFRDNSGVFDEGLYKRRVFFIDAKDALKARNGTVIDEKALTASGVPRLEREIRQVVSTDERLQALFASTTVVIAGIIREAQVQLEHQKQALSQPLDALIARRDRIGVQLDALMERRQALHERIERAAEYLVLKYHQSLQHHLDSMEQRWQANAETNMPMSDIRLRDLMQCAVSDEAKSRVAKVVQIEIEAYVNNEFSAWSDSIRPTLEQDLVQLQSEAQQEALRILHDLRLLQDDFAGQHHTNPTVPSVVSITSNPLALASLNLDADIGIVLKDALNQLYMVLGVVVAAVLFTPVGWVAGAAGAFLGGKWVEATFKERLRKEIGKDLHTRMKADIDLSNVMRNVIARQVFGMAKQLTTDLEARIHDTRRQMQHILNSIQAQKTTAAQEIRRLEQIEVAIDHHFNRYLQAGLRPQA